MKKSIVISQMGFQYPDGTVVFDDFSLKLEPGLINGIIARKSEGTSTLLKILCGRVFAQSGKVEVLDMNPAQRSAALLKDIYYIPQIPNLPSVRIDTFETTYAPFYPNFNTDNFYKYLNLFNLDNYTEKINTLTNSDRRKVLISFGIATNTPILLLDSPTEGMDAQDVLITSKLLKREINKSKCILIASAPTNNVSELIENYLFMHEHKLIFQATETEIKQSVLFGKSSAKPTHTNLVYTLENKDNFAYIQRNDDSGSTAINIELLYDALIHPEHKTVIEHTINGQNQVRI